MHNHSLRCWNVTGPKVLELAHFQCVDPAAHEVQLEFLTCGICGSDKEMYHKGGVHSAHAGAAHHLTLGHEIVARVVAVGTDVRSHSIGDVVAVEPGLPCEKCNSCLIGAYHCCPNTRYMGTPPQDGGLADVFNWPAKWSHVLPESLKGDPLLASLTEPLACCNQAFEHRERLAPLTSDKMWSVITGSGTMAMGVLAIIKARNPKEKVLVMARSQKDREFALSFGADAAVALSGSAQGSPEFATENLAAFAEAKRLTGGFATNVVECTGSNPLLESLIKAQCILAGGAIIGLGCHYGISIDVAHLRRHELAFQPIRRSAHQFPKVLQLLAQKPDMFRPLIGGTVSFEDFGAHMEGKVEAKTVNEGGPKIVIVK